MDSNVPQKIPPSLIKYHWGID